MQISDIANLDECDPPATDPRDPNGTQMSRKKTYTIYIDNTTTSQNLVEIGSAVQKFTLWQEPFRQRDNANNNNNDNNYINKSFEASQGCLHHLKGGGGGFVSSLQVWIS